METGTGGFINPEKVIAQLNVKPGMKVADFGCGHGYFTLPIAKAIGQEGRVWAIDVLSEALEAVRSRAQLEGVVNIETARGDLEAPNGSKLSDGFVDLVLLHNVLFQSQKKSAIIKEAKRVLKTGGVFVLVDWRKDLITIGPQDGWRLSFDEARALAQEESFVFNKVFEAGEYHYGLMFIKP
ncbi:class I SAM-dependent methyltransferase, partial [Patescibacteria group bacterium]|nr:class I SAM-dependent methyltransferase [Patescibacteria group bacterium]